MPSFPLTTPPPKGFAIRRRAASNIQRPSIGWRSTTRTARAAPPASRVKRTRNCASVRRPPVPIFLGSCIACPPGLAPSPRCSRSGSPLYSATQACCIRVRCTARTRSRLRPRRRTACMAQRASTTPRVATRISRSPRVHAVASDIARPRMPWRPSLRWRASPSPRMSRCPTRAPSFRMTPSLRRRISDFRSRTALRRSELTSGA